MVSHVNWRQPRVFCWSAQSFGTKSLLAFARHGAYPITTMALSYIKETDNSQNGSSVQPLSINRICALFPREQLLAHPLHWTERQFALLDCRIHDRDTLTTNSAKD